MSSVQVESEVSISPTVSFRAFTSDWMLVILPDRSAFTASSSILMDERFTLRAACSSDLKIAAISLRSEASSSSLKAAGTVSPAGTPATPGGERSPCGGDAVGVAGRCGSVEEELTDFGLGILVGKKS